MSFVSYSSLSSLTTYSNLRGVRLVNPQHFDHRRVPNHANVIKIISLLCSSRNRVGRNTRYNQETLLVAESSAAYQPSVRPGPYEYSASH